MASKLMVLIIVFLICILFGVHANDPISTSFNRSSLPISLPRPFKLDNVHSQFSLCLKEKVEAQNESKCALSSQINIFFESFIHCMRKMHPHDPMYKKATDAYILCIEKHGEDIFDAGNCLHEWYDLQTKIH